jgi:hypothetical protein
MGGKSNTGYKCITDMEPHNGDPYLRVSVTWRKETVVEYIPKWKYKNPLRYAVRRRNRLEREMGKPRTEKFIASSGTLIQRMGTGKKTRRLEWERK